MLDNNNETVYKFLKKKLKICCKLFYLVFLKLPKK